MTEGSSTKEHRELTVTRILDAPREVVWKAWTDPAQFAYWFGGEAEVPVSTVSLDVRPGGAWNARMLLEDGTEIPFGGVYREVQEPERLVMIFEEVGRQTDADQQVVTVTLADLGGKTELVLTQAGILDEEDFKGLEAGYGSFLDKLEELLAKR
jgi:uncharacterized protein YndB with AHSA1/START domain